MRVLIIEDDERVAAALVDAVEDRGYRARRVGSAADGLAAAATDAPDVALLDLGLPDRDGMELCREMRAHCPVIVVSARGDVPSRIQGLRAGADDFVVKPFSLGELLARIEAVLRRAAGDPGAADAAVEVGAVAIDPGARTASVDGRALALTPKEFALLLALAREQGRAVDRQRLVLEVWGSDDARASRTLDVHVATLRRKLGRRDSVETVRGVGYRLLG